MKAKPYRMVEGRYEPCATEGATHVLLHMPGPLPNRMIPVILKGSRDQHDRSQVWSWNGDTERPTLKPSIRTMGTEPITDDEHRRIMSGEKVAIREVECHTWVNDGKAIFLGDCTHELAGQTLDLLDVEW